MSEMQNAEGQKNEATENQSEQVVSKAEFEKALKTIEELQSSKERILNESKEFKSKWRSLEQQKADEEKERALKSGNLEEVIKTLKSENETIKSATREKEAKLLEQKLKFEIARQATDSWDVVDVIKALPKEMLTLNEDAMEFEGIEKAVNWVRENKKYLFKTVNAASMTSEVPHTKPMASGAPKTIGQMTQDEKNLLMQKAIEQTLRR